MRDNPLHNYLQFLVGEIPDQMGLGALRWFTVVLYFLLLTAGIGVAVYNLRRDHEQRTVHHLWVFIMRFVSAHMWYLGTLWKLPLPIAAGFKYWIENTVKYSSYQAHSDFMQIFVDHLGLVQPLVYLLEVFFTASLMLGVFVRFTGILAAVFTANLWIGLYNDPTEWPWTYMGIICAHGMFAASHAGRSLGLDNLIAKRWVPIVSEDGFFAKLARSVS